MQKIKISGGPKSKIAFGVSQTGRKNLPTITIHRLPMPVVQADDDDINSTSPLMSLRFKDNSAIDEMIEVLQHLKYMNGGDSPVVNVIHVSGVNQLREVLDKVASRNKTDEKAAPTPGG